MFITILCLCSFGLHGQNSVKPASPEEERRQQLQREREEFDQEIEEQFKSSNDLIRKFFDENELKGFHKNFRQLFKDFNNMQDMDDAMFGTPGSRQLFKQAFGGNRRMFEKVWQDGPKEDQVSLILKLKHSGGKPLNIQIEKGILKVNGTIKTERKNKKGHVISSSTSSVNIQEPLGREGILPDPVEMNQNKEGHLIFVFQKDPKIKVLRPKSKKRPMPNKPNRRPLPHQKSGKTI